MTTDRGYIRVSLRRETHEDLAFLQGLMGAKGISDMIDFLIGYYTLESEKRGKKNARYLEAHREELMRIRQ